VDTNRLPYRDNRSSQERVEIRNAGKDLIQRVADFNAQLLFVFVFQNQKLKPTFKNMQTASLRLRKEDFE